MGIKGLWKIIEPKGKSITMKELKGKVIAIDISYWIIRLLFSNKESQRTSNEMCSEVMKIFCKCISFGIKPIFVFDGKTATYLKEETVRKRFEKKKQEEQKRKEQQTRHFDSLMNGTEKREKDFLNTEELIKIIQEDKEREKEIGIKDEFSGQISILEMRRKEIEQEYNKRLEDGKIRIDAQEFGDKQIIVKKKLGDIEREINKLLKEREKKIGRTSEELREWGIGSVSESEHQSMIESYIEDRNSGVSCDNCDENDEHNTDVLFGTSFNQSSDCLGLETEGSDNLEGEIKKMNNIGFNDFLSDSGHVKTNAEFNKTTENKKNDEIKEEEVDDLGFIEELTNELSQIEKQDVVEEIETESFLTPTKQHKIVIKKESSMPYQPKEEIDHKEQTKKENKTKILETNGIVIKEEIKEEKEMSTRDELRKVLEEENNRAIISEGIIHAELKERVIEMLKKNSIPFVLAPGEAEAECIQLEKNGKCDYIASNDSDVFGYGGKQIIRNFLVNKEEMKLYCANSIPYSQNQIVLYSLIVGNDYSDGIRGIGKEKGKKIIETFDNIQQFVDYMNQTNIDSTKYSNEIIKIKKSIILPSHFPDTRIIRQYESPNVTSDITNFSWENIRQSDLQNYCLNELKWNKYQMDTYYHPASKYLN